MSDPEKSPADRRPSAAEERAERLAAELRANLRRRKDQARGRETATLAPEDPPRRAPASEDGRSPLPPAPLAPLPAKH